jgi:hypothetical protein
MSKNRRLFWLAGLLILAAIAILLFKPASAGSLTMAVLLLAAALAALAMRR